MASVSQKSSIPDNRRPNSCIRMFFSRDVDSRRMTFFASAHAAIGLFFNIELQALSSEVLLGPMMIKIFLFACSAVQHRSLKRLGFACAKWSFYNHHARLQCLTSC